MDEFYLISNEAVELSSPISKIIFQFLLVTAFINLYTFFFSKLIKFSVDFSILKYSVGKASYSSEKIKSFSITLCIKYILLALLHSMIFM